MTRFWAVLETTISGAGREMTSWEQLGTQKRVTTRCLGGLATTLSLVEITTTPFGATGPKRLTTQPIRAATASTVGRTLTKSLTSFERTTLTFHLRGRWMLTAR